MNEYKENNLKTKISLKYGEGTIIAEKFNCERNYVNQIVFRYNRNKRIVSKKGKDIIRYLKKKEKYF